MTQAPPENALLAAWKSTLDRRGDAPAVLSTAGAVLRTFSQIEADAAEYERLFSEQPARSVVAVQIGNSERWPALLLALFRRQLVVLPLGRHMENGELDLALETCQAALLVSLADGELRLTRCAPMITRSFAWDEPAPDLLKLTSGTTSLPRAIRFRAPQLVADCASICDTMGLTERDLNFGVIPFSHSYGFSNLVTPLICRGVPLVASEDRMPRAILNDLARSGATVFPGMPVFFQKFAELQNTLALPALRLCISAGSLLQKNVAENFTAAFRLKIHAFYGSSECGGIAYDASDEPYRDEGFVGQPMRGVEIASASAQPSPIVVRSAAVGDDYFPNRDRSALGDGRFIPGDLVRCDERGLHLAGRVSDVINIAGRKLNPLEVEARLAEIPGVKQVVVFGVPSALRGEEAVACVAGDGVEPPAVLRFCQGRLSAW
ncbi:MAG TPA: class I adenylate-forming enzyme family protein, partial [Chthoniobacteraceae bacterium]|nr:class I adenylate-forming enzyme family protein [Chthoniobacteraceae bacterium]